MQSIYVEIGFKLRNRVKLVCIHFSSAFISVSRSKWCASTSYATFSTYPVNHMSVLHEKYNTCTYSMNINIFRWAILGYVEGLCHSINPIRKKLLCFVCGMKKIRDFVKFEFSLPSCGSNLKWKVFLSASRHCELFMYKFEINDR